MMHTSMLRQEELRTFEELISGFDSLSEAEMSAVGVTPEWSAKDLLAHLAYWERAAAEEIREFEAGRWPAKKRTRGQMERINRELVLANRATPRHLHSRGTDPGEDRNRGGDGSSARGTGGKVSARSHRLLSLRTAQGASPGTTSRLGSTSWQNIVNARARFGSSQPQHSWRPEVRSSKLVGIRRPERVSTQLNSADAGPRSSNKSLYHSLLDALGGCLLFVFRLLSNVDLSSSPFKRNFVHSQFH